MLAYEFTVMTKSADSDSLRCRDLLKCYRDW